MDFNPKRETLFALLAAVIALLAYSQFFGIELAEFDTVAKLTSYTNPDISEVARIFTQPEQFYTNHSTNYRPVESLIFWVTFIFQGFNLKAFHLVNFLFHAVNTLLVFFLAKRLIRDRSHIFSLLAALLFALHPINMNAVLFIGRLHEPLVLFFTLLSILLLMKFFENRDKRFFVFSIIACAFGIFSKEAGVLIPFILFFYVFSFSGIQKFKKNLFHSLRFCVPYFALVPIYVVMMFIALGKMGGYAGSGRGLMQPYVILISLWALFSPLFYPFFGAIQDLLSTSLLILNYPTGLIVFFSFIVFFRKFSRNQNNWRQYFLPFWLAGLFMAFTLFGWFPYWYAYLFVAPFAIFLALLLAKNISSFRSSIFSKVVVLFVFLFFVSVAVSSPLLTNYSWPHEASALSNSVLNQSLLHAESVPSNSRIFLINYPRALVFSGNTFTDFLFPVDDSSTQAFLDFYLPEKKLQVAWLNKSIILAPVSETNISFECSNCSCLIENKFLDSTHLAVASPWKSFETATPIRIRSFQSDVMQGMEFTFVKEDSANAFIFVFDGQKIHLVSQEELCQ